MTKLTNQETIRRKKIQQLKLLGINPYPADEYQITHNTLELKDQSEEGIFVKIAGRIMALRIMGKSTFIQIQDEKGRLQLYISRQLICHDEKSNCDKYDIFIKKILDIGDIIGAEGYMFRTKVGELSLKVKDIKILCKSLRPLPLPKVDSNGKIYDSFTDIEQRYRMRYVDLIVNPENKCIFIKRAKLYNLMREYFNNLNYLEVETPILQPIPGGATAKPFVTHHNSLNMPLYLRIANELYLKRLIVGGFEGVYEFAKSFRNEGMDRSHNPEFTGLEIYIAYKDYIWMLNFTENLLEHCCKNLNDGKTDILYNNIQISFKKPFNRITMRDAILKYSNFDIYNKTEQDIFEAALEMGLDVDKTMGKGKLIDKIFGEKCESNFIQPTFILDYPKEMSPLTKNHRSLEGFTERFELIVCGKEIANCYSELNDPIEQLNRFKEQVELSERGDDEAMFIDMDFIKSLEYGMPPTAGLGIGMDRLLMFLTNQQSIQEVLLFPHMRNKI